MAGYIKTYLGRCDDPGQPTIAWSHSLTMPPTFELKGSSSIIGGQHNNL